MATSYAIDPGVLAKNQLSTTLLSCLARKLRTAASGGKSCHLSVVAKRGLDGDNPITEAIVNRTAGTLRGPVSLSLQRST
jgi:hypothetical protein